MEPNDDEKYYFNFSFFQIDPKWRWMADLAKEESAKEVENVIKNNGEDKILLGKEEIGKIVGFSIKIYSNFGSNKNNFVNKILQINRSFIYNHKVQL